MNVKTVIHILWIILLSCLIILGIFAYKGSKLGDKLEAKDAEISELKKENETLQEERDKVIEEKLEEIQDLTEERNVALERVAELEPAVQEADLRIERLEQEYEELVSSGASTEDLLKNALAQVDTLKLEVAQVKEQRDKALTAFNLEAASKAAAMELADQWRQKYESEHTVRTSIESAYEMSKDQIRILKFKGTIGAVAGGVLGFVGGLLLGK